MEGIFRPVYDGREQNVLAIIVYGHFLEIEVCRRSVRSGFRLHSRFSHSEVVAPPMMVDLSLVVAAVTLALAD